jgi:molecular chaperone DnaK (HSP70)
MKKLLRRLNVPLAGRFSMLLFSILALFSHSALIAVDLGSEFVRTSMLQRGRPVSLVLTPEGRRYRSAVAAILPISSEAPSIFTPEDVTFFQRSVGDLSIVQRYPLNSTRFLPLLLGKNYSSNLVSYLMRRNLTMPFDADEDDALELVAPPEFFAAQLFMLSVSDAKKVRVNLTVDSLALVVPKFLTHHQRCGFVRAARLATFNPILVDTMDAVGHLFAVERGHLFKNRSLMVCFIDIGASQIQVSIQEFKYTESVGIEIQEIGYAWSDRVGSYSIDVALARLIRREIVNQKPDAIFDDKSVQKIVVAARRFQWLLQRVLL